MSRDFDYEQHPGGDVLRLRSRGRNVLVNPLSNIGTAFTREERQALGLIGMLPPQVLTLDTQVQRSYAQYRVHGDAMSKYGYLHTLHERNEVLYYRLLTEHLEEMLPIVYTPTIGQVIKEYSWTYHRPRGVYLDIDHPDDIEESLTNSGLGGDEVDLVVVTDSEGILGIGDQGIGGIAITIGKLSLYVAAGGFNPHRVLAVGLDVGTDNLDLLAQDGYLGLRHARVRGERYDEFIEQFVSTVHRLYPQAMIHWEDFGAANAHRLLNKYRPQICTFNDDIQGTAAVVVAAILAGVKRTGGRLQDQRIVVHGAGTAGIGIADLLMQALVERGMETDAARRLFWGLGSRGLLREGIKMRDFQEPYARPASEVKGWHLEEKGKVSLADVVHNVHPTILIGTSAQANTFTQDIITDMASHCDQPIIMPLSNPTEKVEALPEDIIRWTGGRALIATGSPYEPVDCEGRTYTNAQANNALVFPGIGLGVITCHPSGVSDKMIAAASTAAAEGVPSSGPGASLLPSISHLRSVSARVAVAVVKAAEAEGLAEEVDNPVQAVYDRMWQPRYPQIVAE